MKTTDMLIYTNKTENIELGFFTSYIITNFEEITENKIITTKAVLQDGTNYINSNLDNKYISISGFIPMKYDYEFLERKLKICFSPKTIGKLKLIRTNETKEIETIAQNVISFKRKKGISNFKIDLMALNPFWQWAEQVNIFSLIKKTLVFPIYFNKPVLFGSIKNILEDTIDNVGDVVTGFKVYFKARGKVNNPHIINKLTGQKIKVNHNMEQNDIIEIVSMVNKKMIYLNGKKKFDILNRNESDFFYLDIGKNVLTYGADLNYSNLDLIIYYNPLFL
jgi:hypothetical protein